MESFSFAGISQAAFLRSPNSACHGEIFCGAINAISAQAAGVNIEVVALDEGTISKLALRLAEALQRSAAASPLVVDLAGAMRLMGITSQRAFHHECRDIGLVSYRRGRYRVRDIENALAKASRRAHDVLEREKARTSTP